MPNGAQALMKTLADAGIDVCFTNPGTSEMHFVAALDSEPRMRAVLALFEGVATGAADGYARMADKPAATLLHLGCGLGNGLANLHNARKGKVPVLNIVGDHATYHVPLDAQLQSDIETVARNVSPGFVRTSRSTEALCRDAAACTASSDAGAGVAGDTGAAGSAPSFQDTSAGRISVATCPGGPIAAATASAASPGSSAVLCEVLTQRETLRATVSMSDWSWALYCVWYVAWSPTMLTTGTLPLRALCRLASPLPSPGPRCRRGAAGTPAIRE